MEIFTNPGFLQPELQNIWPTVELLKPKPSHIPNSQQGNFYAEKGVDAHNNVLGSKVQVLLMVLELFHSKTLEWCGTKGKLARQATQPQLLLQRNKVYKK